MHKDITKHCAKKRLPAGKQNVNIDSFQTLACNYDRSGGLTHNHAAVHTACSQISTPFKKVTQHDFDRLYFFYPGFLFIKFDTTRKPVYLPFE